MSDQPRQIDYLPLDEIRGADSNPKTHHADLGSSIDRFGFADAPIMDERTGRLVAGHGRVEQLQAMRKGGEKPPEGIDEEGGHWFVPVQRGWSSRSDAEASAFLVAHNRIGEAGGWDDKALGELLASLADTPDVEVSGLGIEDKELQQLISEARPEEPAEDPGAGEPPAEPVSKRGEVYALGPHRLMCGDSTSAEDVAALLGGEEPRLMVTDPPYGVNYDPAWRQRAGVNDGGRLGRVTNDDRSDWSEAWALFSGAVAYVWHNWIMSGEVKSHMAASGLEMRSMVVWAKPAPVFSRGHYHVQHEVCWYAVLKGEAAEWVGDRSQTTLWAIQLDKNVEGGHSTQKPLECMERPIRNHEGDVYDPFLGSGTTLIAAARQGRRCYGMEISPAYCDVIRKRWGEYARGAGIEPGPDAL